MTSRNSAPDYSVHRFVVGPMAVNCYVISDTKTKEACIIDPGAEPAVIKKFLDKNGLNVKFIINTHGHGDHIAANGNFNVPILIHHLDEDFLTDPEKNLSSHFFFNVRSPKASKTLEDGDLIRLGSLKLEIMHTPGHTPGSVSVILDGAAFTGDALFAGGIGRTDFVYGDGGMLLNSIKKKLLILNDDTVIYPGHGESSTIGIEKRSNPFL